MILLWDVFLIIDTLCQIVIHKLKEEAKRIGSEELADEELKHGISTMLKTMEGSQPWHAEWPFNLRETKKLTALLVRASRWGIPLTASFIQVIQITENVNFIFFNLTK